MPAGARAVSGLEGKAHAGSARGGESAVGRPRDLSAVRFRGQHAVVRELLTPGVRQPRARSTVVLRPARAPRPRSFGRAHVSGRQHRPQGPRRPPQLSGRGVPPPGERGSRQRGRGRLGPLTLVDEHLFFGRWGSRRKPEHDPRSRIVMHHQSGRDAAFGGVKTEGICPAGQDCPAKVLRGISRPR